METSRATATESLGSSSPGPSHDTHSLSSGAPPVRAPAGPQIRIRRRTIFDSGKGKDIDLFTMSLGDETIELMPLRNWGQLDVYKWRAQGRLPGTPAGLEITYDHIKLAGETVLVSDPEGCAKLEKLFAEWLALERETQELARQKAKAKPTVVQQTAAAAEPQAPHYSVETDKSGQVHIKCTQGKETVATIGLNTSGFHSLVTQGLMRKPRALRIGALHDWVELDGVLFSFEKGQNEGEKLARILNERYVPPVSHGLGKDVVIYANPASSTGFDIQFPVSVGGITDNRRRPLNEESLELLQDPNKCGLLHKEVVIKLARPHFIFKLKTPDGGERYFESLPENQAVVRDEDGQERMIDLSHPVNYLKLDTMELTAVFNHPAIHQHGKATPRATVETLSATPQPLPGLPVPHEAPIAPPALGGRLAPAPITPPETASSVTAPPLPSVLNPPAAPPLAESLRAPAVLPPVPPAKADNEARRPPSAQEQQPGEAPPAALEEHEDQIRLERTPQLKTAQDTARPNAWLKEALSKPAIRHDWLACVMYGVIAERFGNSTPGKLGLSSCWSVALSETRDAEDPAFKGFFLTQKGGLGFLNQGHIVRFNKGVAFLGTQETALEGIDVALIGAGVDARERAVFIAEEPYRTKFGVPPQAVEKELASLRECGIVVLGVSEALESPDPLEVVWTVPKEQANPDDIQAEEHVRPEPAQVAAPSIGI